MIKIFLIQFIIIFSRLLIFAIFARVIFSWFKSLNSGGLYNFLYAATEPVLTIVRRILPIKSGIDFSPIIAFLGIDLLRMFLLRLLGA